MRCEALALEVGVERARRAAVGVGDEDADVRAVALADLLDLGGDGVGDQLGSHVQARVDAFDADARDARGEGEQLARERATADDDEPGRDLVRPHWRGARR